MKPALILTIVLSLALSASQALASGDPVAGKEKAATCVACHGEDGNSTNPMYPTLAGQYPTYLVKTLEDYKSGARKNPIMSGFAAALSEQDREDLAAYFSQQKGLSIKQR